MLVPVDFSPTAFIAQHHLLPWLVYYSAKYLFTSTKKRLENIQELHVAYWQFRTDWAQTRNQYQKLLIERKSL